MIWWINVRRFCCLDSLQKLQDAWHTKVASLLPTLLQTDDKVYVTDYIVLETVNHLLRKTSFDAAKETLEMFIRSPRITTIHNDENAFRQTYDFFAKYPGLSVTDANIVLHMLRLKERNLFSFDNGFDIVKEISRRLSS